MRFPSITARMRLMRMNESIELSSELYDRVDSHVVDYLEELQAFLGAGFSSNIVARELFNRLHRAGEWRASMLSKGETASAELIQGYIWVLVNAWDRFTPVGLDNGIKYYRDETLLAVKSKAVG